MTRGQELLQQRDRERRIWLDAVIASEKKELPIIACSRCAKPCEQNAPQQRYCKPCSVDLHHERNKRKAP